MEFESEFEKNLFELRQTKLKEIEKLGQPAYPNRFPARQDETATTLAAVRVKWNKATPGELETKRPVVSVAGRIMAIRLQGKAGFATLQQASAWADSQAPISQPMNAAEGSSSAICTIFSACTHAPRRPGPPASPPLARWGGRMLSALRRCFDSGIVRR